jgi:hypothetical protein
VRTTVTLEPDVARLLEDDMRATGATFKEALNRAVRRGLMNGAAVEPDYRQVTFALGAPRVDLTHALRVAGALEDEELIRKQELGR